MDPDDELINNILIKLLHDRQIIINNDEILSFIFKRINRTHLDIYNFVDKLDKLSLSKKKTNNNTIDQKFIIIKIRI